VEVGVGSNVDITELNGVASYPATANVFTVQDYSSLTGIETPLLNSVCNGKQAL